MNVAGELAGARIRALCELEGISRKALADELCLSAVKLSKIENGAQRFTDDLAVEMSRRHGVPFEFFTVQDALVEAVTPTFRKKARAKAGDEKRVVRLAREAARVFEAASRESGYRPFEFPDDDDLLADEEQCAVEIRRAGGLDATQPIPNVTRLFERQGIGVVAGLLPGAEALDRDDLSGVSLPTGRSRRPLVSLPAPMPGAVARFTLAHEVAHHLWDRDLPAPLTSTRDPRELRAHRFAGALLLPADVMRKRVSEGTSLRGLLPVKADYGVSVGAIIMRARHLGLITPERSRSLHIQLASLKWRDPAIEPVEVADERPLLLKQTLQRATDFTALGLARYTGLPPELIRRWATPEASEEPAEQPGDVIDFAAARAQRRATTPTMQGSTR